ncbi:DUF6511 domain-containing protein [Roseicella sp. DB1501]|uniref:DUF6511 domain-containing protein n=1 Tax=Roseicella sp. DB1501 TaxID=2730925 RepID=UPI001492D09B|nr:DUF6511 domain-containing protein [Roseicella sp. DB1501]NOG73741.1 hypothetical protein [Roseicella sp. DB1501]
MPNPDVEPHQREAMIFAGAMVGEYLESIGQTDLAKLDAEQWQTFLEVVCLNYYVKVNILAPCPF